ncbi:MAG: DUF4446 family protein [Candidatus Nanopelagicales bacterium]
MELLLPVDQVASIALTIAIVSVVFSFGLLIWILRLKKKLLVLQKSGDKDTFLGAVNKYVEKMQNIATEQAKINKALVKDDQALQAQIDEIKEAMTYVVSRVATVRYDAFNNMGGQMSFSTAMLNDLGDGIVVTAINGRSETRTYIRNIKNKKCDVEISREEAEAINKAMAN